MIEMRQKQRMRSRRQVLRLIGALALIPEPPLAEDNQAFPIRADDGAPTPNFRIPSELDPATTPGIVWSGARAGDVLVYEFFDYNCAFCRKASAEIEAIIAKDGDVRLGFLNNPILSIGSIQSAKVQQAVLRLHGPQAAHDFHVRMFGKHGQSNGASALAVAAAIGFDVRKIELAADSPVVTDVLARQTRLAADLGMSMTPSFVVSGIGLMGWPGPNAFRSIIEASRKCDHPVCGQ